MKQAKPRNRKTPYGYSERDRSPLRKESDEAEDASGDAEMTESSADGKSGEAGASGGASNTTVLLRNENRVRPHMNHARMSMKRAHPINITTIPKLIGIWSFANIMDTPTRLKYDRWASVFDMVRMTNVKVRVYNMAPWITNATGGVTFTSSKNQNDGFAEMCATQKNCDGKFFQFASPVNPNNPIGVATSWFTNAQTSQIDAQANTIVAGTNDTVNSVAGAVSSVDQDHENWFVKSSAGFTNLRAAVVSDDDSGPTTILPDRVGVDFKSIQKASDRGILKHHKFEGSEREWTISYPDTPFMPIIIGDVAQGDDELKCKFQQGSGLIIGPFDKVVGHGKQGSFTWPSYGSNYKNNSQLYKNSFNYDYFPSGREYCYLSTVQQKDNDGARIPTFYTARVEVTADFEFINKDDVTANKWGNASIDDAKNYEMYVPPYMVTELGAAEGTSAPIMPL